MISGRQYLYETRVQGIQLHPNLVAELSYPSFQPADQIYNAFGLLPETLLNTKQLPPISAHFELPSDIAMDTPARLFTDALNSTLQPPHEDRPVFNGFEGVPIVGCGDAEARFTRTIRSIGSMTTDGQVVSNGAQIITWEDRPILVRKGHGELYDGESSALSLEPIHVNGMTYPSFSLFGVSLDSANNSSKCFIDKQVRIFDASDIVKLSFRRLSLFALREKERRQIKFDIEDFSFMVCPQPEVVSTAYTAIQKLKAAQLSTIS